MNIRTLILSGVVALVAAPALAGDGNEDQRNVYAGLRPAQTFTVTPALERRVAVFKPAQTEREVPANDRIKDLNINSKR